MGKNCIQSYISKNSLQNTPSVLIKATVFSKFYPLVLFVNICFYFLFYFFYGKLFYFFYGKLFYFFYGKLFYFFFLW